MKFGSGLAYLLLILQLTSTQSLVTVNTTRGQVHGFHIDYGPADGRFFFGSADIFLGIPFALPPIGDLRFRLPRPICSYDKAGINATAYRASCPSDDLLEPPYAALNPRSEDCLHLNIISPSASVPGRYPVIVYIHGGSFERGAASTFEYKGAVRQFAAKGVVMVVIQYRLGILGFFTTFTPEFPANRGIFDQVMALRWVHEEIAAFGGDPCRVTLSGESAGAASASVLALSPLARGLFQQVIQHSGSAWLDLNFVDAPDPSTNKLQANLLCNFTDADWANGNFSKLATCMHAMPWQQFIKQEMTANGLTFFAYEVAVDGVLLPDTPSKLAKQRPNYPVIIGNMRDEFFGCWDNVTADEPGKPANLSQFSSSTIQAEMLKMYPYLASNRKQLEEILLSNYAGNKPPADNDHLQWLKIATAALSDMVFNSGGRREANWHVLNGNHAVYLFTFDYHAFGASANKSFQGWQPVQHASELSFLMCRKFEWEPALNTSQATPTDIAIADFLSEAWTNFAKMGRPHPDWPPVSSLEAMEFFHVTSPKGNMEMSFCDKTNLIFNSAFPDVAGEFPAESMSEAARKHLFEDYVPTISAEFAQSTSCPNERPVPDCSTITTKLSTTPTTPAFMPSTTSLSARVIDWPFSSIFITLSLAAGLMHF